METFRTYKHLVADILFWHSCDYDGENRPIAVKEPQMTLGMIQAKSRIAKYLRARQDIVAMLRARDPTIWSLKRIGGIISRDHSTVLHSLCRTRRAVGLQDRHRGQDRSAMV
jgi:hypothetical protein